MEHYLNNASCPIKQTGLGADYITIKKKCNYLGEEKFCIYKYNIKDLSLKDLKRDNDGNLFSYNNVIDVINDNNLIDPNTGRIKRNKINFDETVNYNNRNKDYSFFENNKMILLIIFFSILVIMCIIYFLNNK